MIPINSTYAPLQAFVDELARCGLSHAVTCPGSRNAPLLLTLAAESRIRCLSVLDERSAGYVAIGIAKVTGRPVALSCTSGTAAANFLPAIAEAREARVPLIVLTADRPPELRDTGAGQAIDQVKLYGAAAKWFVEVGNHEPGRGAAVHHRALGCRAWHTARGGRPGVVHLNFPLREPLAPVPEELDPEPWQGRPDGRPWVWVDEPSGGPPGELARELADEVSRAPRGAIVCGPTAEEVAGPAARLAAAAGWPLLAEPTSGVRCGPHDRSHVIAHYDVLLRSERFAGDHRPDLVVRVGDTPTSKPLRAWLESARQLVIDPHATWHEPTRAAERMVAAPAPSTCEAIAELLEGIEGGAEGWLSSWRAADALVPAALAAAPEPFEPAIHAALATVAAEGSILWLGSSMPVRDVESFFPQTGRRLRFLANRGANGIDGVVSSAVGAAFAGEGPCFLLIGDLSLVYDLGGLLAAKRHGIELTILCVNNGGGAIFDFLPVAEHADPSAYEEQIVTPSGVDLERVAALVDMPHRRAATRAEVADAVAHPGLVEVVTDRRANVAAHRSVFAEVAKALEAGAPVPAGG